MLVVVSFAKLTSNIFCQSCAVFAPSGTAKHPFSQLKIIVLHLCEGPVKGHTYDKEKERQREREQKKAKWAAGFDSVPCYNRCLS